MLICNNECYANETMTFSTVEKFLGYCRQALGEVPELTHQEQAEHDDALAERFAAEADEEAEVERHFAEEREDAERLTAALKGVGIGR